MTLVYPFFIWFGQGTLEPRVLAALLVAGALLRLPALKASTATRWWIAGAALLAALAIWANALLPLKLYPVLVNLLMLALFAHSLVMPPSMVERFARLKEPELPAQAVMYTRRVTQVWCGFFAINGTIALASALWASEMIWSVYNGMVSYLLMGLLFGGEYLVRVRYRRRHGI